MTKSDLVEKVASDCGLSKADAAKALDSVLTNITKALKKKQKVTIVGFGTFSVTQRNARKGRNPSTGQVIEIPAKKVVKFKAGSKLMDAVS